MPSAPSDELRRPGDLLVLDHDRARLEPVQRLLDDLQRLVHLGHADQVAAPGVAGVGGRHLEVVGLVAEVGLGLAQVPGQAGGAQDRAGDAEREAAGDVEVADVLEPALPDRLAGEQPVEVGHPLRA